jgi:hypothetical protein
MNLPAFSQVLCAVDSFRLGWKDCARTLDGGASDHLIKVRLLRACAWAAKPASTSGFKSGFTVTMGLSCYCGKSAPSR